MTAAELELYRPLWSPAVLGEMERTLLNKIGLEDKQSARIRSQLESFFPEALVTGFDPLIAGMPVNEKDRHVLAAAITGHAQLIVTDNIRHFPEELLKPLGMHAKTADAFLMDLLARYPQEILEALEFMTENTGKAGKPELSLYDILTAVGKTTPNFAAAALIAYRIT